MTTTTPREEEALSARKQQIVATAMLLFAERGFQVTAVREIADAVGLQAGSLYSHFSSKNDILDLGLRPYVAGSLARNRGLAELDAPPVERIRLALEQAITGMSRWPAAAAVLHQDWDYISRQPRYKDVLDLRAEFDRVLRDSLTAAQDGGRLAPDVDVDVVIQFVRAVLGGVVQRYLPSQYVPTDLLADHLHRMIFGGLGASTAGL